MTRSLLLKLGKNTNLVTRLGSKSLKIRGAINLRNGLGFKSSLTEMVGKDRGFTTNSILLKKQGSLNIDGVIYSKDHFTNVTPSILNKLPLQLHNVPNHPLCLLKERIQNHLSGFQHFNNFPPIVKVQQNFDDLLVKPDHPGRSKSDSFYLNQDWMLRTHTTTNELDVYKMKDVKDFTIGADVYRRDEIDSSHYPAFHQIEVVRLFSPEALDQLTSTEHISSEVINGSVHVTDPTADLKNLDSSNPLQSQHSIEHVTALSRDLKSHVNKLLLDLFGSTASENGEEPLKIRWIEAFFPFTSPSWEVEIEYQGKWLEILGCGILKQPILDRAGKTNELGWAGGFGLERLAMVLHNIQDIRLFWSQDPRFLTQFANPASSPVQFKPFSKHPPCIKDIAFWCNENFEENDLNDLVRGVAGDIVESVELIDKFIHPKTNKISRCYRIIYRSMDRNVTNNEINELQIQIRGLVQNELKVELR